MFIPQNRFKFYLKFVCFICCIFFVNAYGQERAERFNFVNIKEGISKTGIFTILQDHEGFIWMGTNGAGLHRYDGIDYKSYIHKINDSNSISSSLVFCAQLDAKNRFWVGTENGLNLYDREQDAFKQIPLEGIELEEKTTLAIKSLAEDFEGNLLIGTYDFGLFKLNTNSLEVTPTKFESSQNKFHHKKNIYCFAKSPNGNVYVGTNHGVRKFNPNTLSLEKPDFHTSNGVYNFDGEIQSMLIDFQGNLWLGTDKNGVIKISDFENENCHVEEFTYSTNRIFSIIQLSDQSIIYGTENEGLIHINLNGSIIERYISDKSDKNSILSNSVWSLFLDKDDRIWMGYYNSGVGVYDKLYDKFKGIESLPNNDNSLQLSSVTGITQDSKGNLWFAMDGGGIDIYNPVSKQIDHINNPITSKIKGLSSLYIESLFVDSKNNIWAGSWNSGVFLLKNGTDEFINFSSQNTGGSLASNCISSFAEDSDGTIWIGTLYAGGLHTYSHKTGKFSREVAYSLPDYDLDTKDIRKVLIDSDEDIWIGTIDALYKLDKKDKGYGIQDFSRQMSVEQNHHISSNHILTLLEGSKKTIWIGTRGAGLCKYDKKNKKFAWYNEKNGQPLNNVNSIVQADNGDMWFSGNSGLCSLDILTNKFTRYTRNDGLLSNDFNINASVKADNGTIYLGNYQGVDYFKPEEIMTNTSLPYSYLKGFKLFNKEVSPREQNAPLTKVISETSSLILTNEQSVFTIEYSAINYTRPEKNKYAYYLEGLESTWNYVGDVRSATYTNLDYGNYTFKLKAANNDGVWNETPLELSIKILPPWWKTKWAIAIYFLLFLLGILLLNILTNRRLKQKQLLENERESRRQKEALNERKLQFFTNISHEFRTPLTLIKNPLEGIISNSGLKLPVEIQEKHRIIYKNTHRLNRLIDELMDYRKLELNKMHVKITKVDIVALMTDICEYFKEESSERHIRLQFLHPMSELYVWIDVGMLEKIIFNLLSNAFKVTQERGNITLKLAVVSNAVFPLINENQVNEAFEISISDTGPGLREEQLNKIFERFYQVDSLNKGYYSGTGIGLEVVRSFIVMHKGKIDVKSKVGEGTTFRASFSMGNAHFSEAEIAKGSNISIKKKQFLLPQKNPTEIQISEDATASSHTLLVVEDNAELRNYLKKELKSQYKIVVANNGEEGLKRISEKQPDLILTDVMMPEMDGFEFCKKVKENIKISHIPILMLTAKTMTEDRIRGIEAGADVYLNKPFDLRVLKSRLNQLLSSRKMLFDKYFSALVPDESEVKTTSLDKEFIQKVMAYINEHIDDPSLSVDELASEVFLSRSQFYRKIKALTNNTAVEFIRKVRLERAKQLIETGNTNINDVCFAVGFSTPSYFSKCFKNEFGVLPTQIKHHT